MQKGNTYRAKTGNIKTMVTSLLNTQEATLPTLQNNYTYDQLNRIVNYDGYTANGLAYHTDYSYDRNGNLKTLNRKVGNNHFDKLGYSYTPNTNQLTVVSDSQGIQPATSGIIDLPNQVEALRKLNIDPNKNPTHNYIYDAIGQLVEDRTEGLVIDWRVDGKVKSVTKTKNTTTTTDDTFITFEYDGLGNRVAKTVNYPGDDAQPGNVKHTYYTRDAQGNVMAVYQTGEPVVITPKDELQLTGAINTDQQALKNIVLTNAEVANQNPTKVIVSEAGEITMRSGTIHPGGQLKVCPVTEIETDEILPGLALTEQHIYGSSRLGVQEPRGIVFGVNDTNTTPAKNVIGDKRYELTNHLGNVLSVISDERNGNKPDVIAFNDYYPFGMLLPNRHGSSDKYRYGFNGKEKDDEVKGEGVQYDYGFRIYDPRLGKFLSTDPLENSFPYYTPYQFAGNKPIWAKDLDGLEEVFYDDLLKTELGKLAIKLSSNTDIAKQFDEAVKSQNKLDIYFFVFESAVGSSEFVEDEVGTIGKLDKKGSLKGLTKGQTIFTDSAKDFVAVATNNFALGSAANKGDIDLEKIQKRYAKGNGIIFIAIATQLLNPSDYLSPELEKVIEEQGINSPATQKIYKRLLENAMNTLIHEAIAHALQDIANEGRRGGGKTTETDHKNYHGGFKETSPTLEDYEKNPKKYKGTLWERVIKQIKLETKKISDVKAAAKS